MEYKEIVRLLAEEGKRELVVAGKKVNITGMARFVSKNMPDDEYIKASLDDGRALLFVEADGVVFVGNNLGEIDSVTTQDIGKREKVEYEGVVYQLDNANDYQYCMEVYEGFPGKDIEGECSFSDYFDESEKKMLSLGVLMNTGLRADVLATLVDIDELEVI